jgi:transcriptional regulator with XRE-family HTH domain
VYLFASETNAKIIEMKIKVVIKSVALLKILAKRNMSQNGLGRYTGLKSGHVSQLINGKRNVSPASRQKILDSLKGVGFDEIFAIRKRK